MRYPVYNNSNLSSYILKNYVILSSSSLRKLSWTIWCEFQRCISLQNQHSRQDRGRQCRVHSNGWNHTIPPFTVMLASDYILACYLQPFNFEKTTWQLLPCSPYCVKNVLKCKEKSPRYTNTQQAGFSSRASLLYFTIKWSNYGFPARILYLLS